MIGVSCIAAEAIVRKLATKKVPARLGVMGTFSGMSCGGLPTPGRPPKTILCATKDKRRVVYAIQSV